MSNFQAPPTWAELLLIDPKSNKPAFNPIWLNWFISLTQSVESGGPITSVTATGALSSSGGITPNITLNASGVNNSFLATMAAHTLKGNNTGGASNPLDLTVAQILTMLGLASGLSTTITTAKLTAGGANGSMTFTNGILTASTPAT